MGSFKEQKRDKIKEGKEQGNDGLGRGEQRVRELQDIKRMIDSLSPKDEDDMQQIRELNNQYHHEGKKAYHNEVESAVKHGKQNLEANKSDIVAERKNVEKSIENVGAMKGRTDLARNEANKVERGLNESAADYNKMEAETEDIENEQERQSQGILRRIENLFG